MAAKIINLIKGLNISFRVSASPHCGVSDGDRYNKQTVYHSDRLRQMIASKGAVAVMPNSPAGASKHPLDTHLYAQEYLVEFWQASTVPSRRRPLRKATSNYKTVVVIASVPSRQSEPVRKIKQTASANMRISKPPVFFGEP